MKSATINGLTARYGAALAAAIMSAGIALRPFPAPAQDLGQFPERKYATSILAAADTARDTNDFELALQLYSQALDAYSALATNAPDSDSEVVRFRTTYCQNQLQALRRRDVSDFSSPGPEGMFVEPQESPEPAPHVKVSPTNLTRAASVLMAAREWQTATTLTEMAESADANDRRVLILKTITLARKGDFEQAREAAAAALALAPEKPEVMIALAMTEYGLGRILESRDILQRALQIDPNSASAHYNLARVLLAPPILDPSGSRTHYGRAIELGGTPDPDLEAATNVVPAVVVPNHWRSWQNHTNG